VGRPGPAKANPNANPNANQHANQRAWSDGTRDQRAKKPAQTPTRGERNRAAERSAAPAAVGRLWADEPTNGAASSPHDWNDSGWRGAAGAKGRRPPVVAPRRGIARLLDKNYWTRQKATRAAVLSILLIVLLACPLDALVRFVRIGFEARGALQHVHNIQTLLPASGSPFAALNADTLQKLKVELTGAEHDFAGLRGDLSGGSLAVAGHIPGVSSPMRSFAALAAGADEAALGGLDIVNNGDMLLAILKGGFFASGSAPPLPGVTPTATPKPTPTATAKPGTTPTPPPPQLDAKTFATLQADFTDAFDHFDSAFTYLGNVDPSTIPSSLVKPQQMAQIQKLLNDLPKEQALVAQARAWINVMPSLLGIGKPNSLLIELMDRSEMRAGGGFIGNYGVMTLSDGKVQPFSLSDTYLLDVPFAKKTGGAQVPAEYASWWPFQDFGLRDSNLYPSFPESAQLGMKLLKQEGGPDVQGVVAVTPPAIGRILGVIGSVKVQMPDKTETVGPNNLEFLIHYYQQTVANNPGTGFPPGDQLSDPRKRFTALLGRAFMEKLHGLSTAQLGAVVQTLIESIHARDIQIYLSDKNAEMLLAANGDDSSIAHGPGDGVTIVDANVGVNKGSQFVTMKYVDNVTVDDKGTATHNLSITYTFNVTNKSLLFGPDHYLTYLRIYAPASAHLTHIEGFQNMQGDDQINHSDEPDRQMWGGYVYMLDHTSYTLKLSWTVPNMVIQDANGNAQYYLDFQHQPGSNQSLTLTVSTPNGKTPGVNINGPLTKDQIVDIPMTCLASPPCLLPGSPGGALTSWQ
jgi:hypothetical protein